MSRYDEWAVHLDPELPDGVLDDDDYQALDRISEVLGDEAVWGGPPAGLRNRLLAAASREVAEADETLIDDDRLGDASHDERADTYGDDDRLGDALRDERADPYGDDDPVVVSIESGAAGAASTPARRRARARWLVPAMTVAAAAIAVIAYVGWPRAELATYDLAGTELAPEASATVEVEPLGAGIAFTLHIVGLLPAGDGEYYAGWLSGEEGMVPIGSFHWREGGNPIELWSGVDIERYPDLGITLQREGEPTVSNGDLVLRGQLLDS